MENTDAQEFLAEAMDYNYDSQPKEEKNLKSEVVNIDIRSKMTDDPCQYAKNGGGYTPASYTIKQLPPGVYSVCFINDMFTYMPEKVITDSLIKFPDSRSEMLLNEITNFWKLKDEFKNGNALSKGGFLHKRGYLLFGPPGSGKTCLIKFVINDIVERGGVVLLGNTHPSNIVRGLKLLRTIEEDKPIVVLFEDFDALLENFDESEYLSILDGENSVDNVLFLATTNYPSKLDPRLYNRPGRFSDVVKIGMPTSAVRKLYLETYLKDPGDIDYIVEKTEGFSLDHLKALILGVYFEKKDLNREIERLKILFKPIKDDSGNRSNIGLSNSDSKF